MCGITGWLDFSNLESNPATLRAMTNAIRHRGPDGDGYYEAGPIHFGHRRLSIIDVCGSQQPMTNEDSSIWVVFNGEIFNFQDLRDRLMRLGHRFQSQGDTETIVHAYEEFGEEFLLQLQGQFAIAIWDQKKETLILARDRMGQLPIYYYQPDSSRVYFGSELKSLLRNPNVSAKIDVDSIASYFSYRYIPEPYSIYLGVRKLPAAHKLVVTKTSSRIEPYWNAPFGSNIDITVDEAVGRLDAILNDAVRSRMVADVPLGAFLSGGIDSSLVVAYMASNSSRPIKTFTIGFDKESHDERQYARIVADRFKTEHHEFVVTSDASSVIPELALAFDEPFADSSALPVYYLAQMTRQHVTVALNGDGGDESFAGYSRYFAAANFESYRKLPSWFRAIVGATAKNAKIGPLQRLALFRRLNRWRHLEESTLGAIYQHSVEWPVISRNKLLSKNVLRNLTRCGGHVSEAVDSAIGLDTLNKIMHGDQRTYLAGDLLVKADRMCMQHSLESRSPFLDHRVVEFAASLNSRIKSPKYQPKHLLKRLMAKFFEPDFINRKKMGFGIPMSIWFRENKKFEQMLLENCDCSEYLNEAEIARLFLDHKRGIADNSDQLWSILMFKAWFSESKSKI